MPDKKDKYRIYIDTGGTFTDCIGFDPRGKKILKKVLSNGSLRAGITAKISHDTFIINDKWDLSRDLVRGFSFHLMENPSFETRVISFDPLNHHLKLEKLPVIDPDAKIVSFELSAGEEAPVLGTRLITETALDEEFPPLEIRLGSTRGTNALLENKGAKTALITTQGFRDLIRIGDQSRPDIFAKEIIKPAPLVEEVIEIEERIDKDGEILRILDDSETEKILKGLKNKGIQSIAVAFLNSYQNPEHEKLIKEMCKSAGFRFISLSSELSSLIKLLERTETSVVNAYLSPVIFNYLENISSSLGTESLKVMTSAGGLLGARSFNPKDSLLSGPAGGVVGVVITAKQSGYDKLISFDMGGTSTDVSRYDRGFDYCYELRVGQARIMSNALSIETVAAGGGSICGFDGFKLFVGPESAGAIPGPACYGAKGPLTLTDVNLLLGKLSEKNFSIPVDISAAKNKLQLLLEEIEKNSGLPADAVEILEGFVSIANETMSGAIRKISLGKGYDPTNYSLVSFGGAGGLHACGIARNLGMKTILIPPEAGLLSALGIANARMERFSTKQVLKVLEDYQAEIQCDIEKLKLLAYEQLAKENISTDEAEVRQVYFYIRFLGQDNSIEIEYNEKGDLAGMFREKYEKLYGHWVENRQIEVEAVRVVVSEKVDESKFQGSSSREYFPEPGYIAENNVPVFNAMEFKSGCQIEGPALLLDDFSTFFLEKGWNYFMNPNRTGIVTNHDPGIENKKETMAEEAELELFTHRFMSVAENMGAILQRTALSVNIKERLDFSCALLDSGGYLVANAPHIPVHLGGLGICVRELIRTTEFNSGDTIVTNHPGFGGSHLPDVTTVSPIFNERKKLFAFVVNRAHHSEIGGLSPGSMPPAAKNLAQEGVVISPFRLVSKGKANWEGMRRILIEAPYPTRAVEENLADLNAALAANMKGIDQVMNLVHNFGEDKVTQYFRSLRKYASERMNARLQKIPSGKYEAEEFLDDGSLIRVRINHRPENTHLDFSGSANVSETNMNATIAIVHSVVIYIMRLLLDEPIPLNDGLLDPINITIPEGMLNPSFPDDTFECPAVVGGNVEISQRLTDTILKAFGTMAASQGTMNNVLFGNDTFGYYETLAGGTGAGDGFKGADATHHHMTNTRITDPEIMELRYPVRINRFEIRKNSGGKGKWKGGDGLVREYEFLEPVNLSLLSQRRNSEPFGVMGGGPGKKGDQYILKKDETKVDFTGIDNRDVSPGDRFVIKTPGGGGYGKP